MILYREMRYRSHRINYSGPVKLTHLLYRQSTSYSFARLNIALSHERERREQDWDGFDLIN